LFLNFFYNMFIVLLIFNITREVHSFNAEFHRSDYGKTKILSLTATIFMMDYVQHGTKEIFYQKFVFCHYGTFKSQNFKFKTFNALSLILDFWKGGRVPNSLSGYALEPVVIFKMGHHDAIIAPLWHLSIWWFHDVGLGEQSLTSYVKNPFKSI